MSSELERDDVDLSRGAEDVIFVHTSVDTEEFSDEDNPAGILLDEMEERGLEVENAHVIGIFRDEFSLLLEENARVKLHGEQVYPEDE